VHDAAALGRARARAPGLTVLDLKAESEALVARYRERILASLALAAVLLVVVVVAALRSARRARACWRPWRSPRS
jgi:predicted exporter